MSSEAEALIYEVVVNHEEQYSIWPADDVAPEGWSLIGISGVRETCMAHIDQVWTDIRPLSVRRPAETA